LSLVIVRISVRNAKDLSCFISKVWKFGDVVSESYLRFRNKNGRYVVRKALFTVEVAPGQLGSLRATFTQLGHHRDANLSIY